MTSQIIVEAMDSEQIRSKCVTEIKTIDDLSSERLGSLEGKCTTCGKFMKECNGHYGFIDLGEIYIFNPLLFQTTLQLLKGICLNCLHFSTDPNKCSKCGQTMETLQIVYLQREQKRIFTNIPLYACVSGVQASKIQSLIDEIPPKVGSKSAKVILHPKYVHKMILRQLFHTKEIKKVIPNIRILECMMINALPVPPTFVRLLNTPDNQNHAMNMVYRTIVQENDYMKKVIWQDDLYYEMSEDNKVPLIHMEKFFTACRCVMFKDTSRNSKPQTRQLIMQLLRISSLEPASCLAQALAKKGWNRQCISSVRVNMSGRTVITGNPRINCNECVIPKFFAETLFVPIPVNNYNIDYLKGMINRYPEYPCALRVIPRNEHIRYKYINEQTKKMFASQVQLGDFVCVQVMDGMIGMVNRYPSVCEESFGALRVRVDMEGKSMQFPLSTIKKMQADFDGDEMQFFCLASLEDQMEVANLYSIPRQFISYGTGKNRIGDAWDLGVGIIALKDNEYPLMTKQTGLEIVQDTLEKIYMNRPELLKSLNYEDDQILIKNGKIEKFGDSLASTGSDFLRYIWFHHGPYIATAYVDHFIHLCYDVNEYCLMSIPQFFFLKKEEYKQLETIEKERIKALQKIMDDYYSGNLHAPAGFPLKLFFEKEYQDALSKDQMKQQDLLYGFLTKERKRDGKTVELNPFYKKFIKKFMAAYFTVAFIHKGNMSDAGRFIYPDEFYDRLFISYPKGYHTPETAGYVSGSYVRGLTQKEGFLSSMNERINLYKKGQATAITGYFSRRLNQGSANIYSGHNGIQFTDGGIVVATQYGGAGYDPHCSISIPFTFHQWSESKLKETFGSHPRFKEMQEICAFFKKYESLKKKTDPYFTEFTKIVVPFKFDEDTISEAELDKLFGSRLCEKMGDVLQDIITNQVFQFYVYCLFYLKIDSKSKYSVLDKYKRSLLPPGEMTGLRSTLSVSEPQTQANLSAIHAKNGMLMILREDRTINGMQRFEELIIRIKAPIVVQFSLLGDLKYNYDANNRFVSKYQTIKFSDLQPSLQIVLNKREKSQYSPFVIHITFSAKQLGFYNINVNNLVNSIKNDNKIIEKIDMSVNREETEITMDIYSSTELKQIGAIQLKTYLLDKQQIGSGLLYNLYCFSTQTDEGDEYKIIGNLTDVNRNMQKDALLSLYKVPGIDQETVYCSAPELYELQGIERIRAQLYQELRQNSLSDTNSKDVQLCHIKLLAQIVTQTGVYSSFTRNQYRKEGQRDMISKFLFEQGEVFLSDEIKNPQKQVTNTLLNSLIYGTDAECGSTISKVLFDRKLKIYDHKKMQMELEK